MSKNAALSQIWTALGISLLLAYLEFASCIELAMQQIARLAQLNRHTISMTYNFDPTHLFAMGHQ